MVVPLLGPERAMVETATAMGMAMTPPEELPAHDAAVQSDQFLSALASRSRLSRSLSDKGKMERLVSGGSLIWNGHYAFIFYQRQALRVLLI